jgi:hypothetical protein
MQDRTVTVIRLWEPPSDCGMCGRETFDKLAVGWFCGPVRQEPGEQVPGWKGEAIAGGMPVCRPCYDRHERGIAA